MHLGQRLALCLSLANAFKVSLVLGIFFLLLDMESRFSKLGQKDEFLQLHLWAVTASTLSSLSYLLLPILFILNCFSVFFLEFVFPTFYYFCAILNGVLYCSSFSLRCSSNFMKKLYMQVYVKSSLFPHSPSPCLKQISSNLNF